MGWPFVLILMLFAFAMAGVVSDRVFERLPHLEDEMAYLFQARTLAEGRLVVESPEPPRPYWQPFLVDLNGTRFGKYTLGWPLQLTPGVLMGQPWVINAFMAALGGAVAYRLGRIFSRDAGVFAAALTAFSPMFLLLNGTLMGHSAALVSVGLFMWACWQIARGKRWTWGLLGGVALGLLVITRPLTAIGIAAPFAAWGAWTVLTDPRRFAYLRAFLPLAAVAGVFALLIPLYNFVATGDPTENLYTLVWPYDRIGFGAGGEYGRSGHTWERAIRHTRFDLSLTAADLFGWQLESFYNEGGFVRADLIDHLVIQSDYYPATGISWVLPLIGLVFAFRRRSPLVMLWIALGVGAAALPFELTNNGITLPILQIGGVPLFQDSRVGWALVIILLGMAALPVVFFRRNSREQFAWLLVAAALSLVIVQLAYWIGSQRYSTRYYYEGLLSAAVISALPLAWLAGRRLRLNGRAYSVRPVVYAAVAGVLVFTHFTYTIPRISTLYGYNVIYRSLYDGVQARQEGDRPVLALVNGESGRWRAYAALSAYTSPTLDSEIVAAHARTPAERAAILARFPDWQVIELDVVDNFAWFRDDPPAVIPTPMPR